jgi:hypothetical protein
MDSRCSRTDTYGATIHDNEFIDVRNKIKAAEIANTNSLGP